MIDGKVFRGVLFDTGGVVTDTARLHLSAWRRLFHDLTEHGDVGNVELGDDDYRHYIDGMDRTSGLNSYLIRATQSYQPEPLTTPRTQSLSVTTFAARTLTLWKSSITDVSR